MKKGSKLCEITLLDGTVYRAFFDETVRKTLNPNACFIAFKNKLGYKTGLFRSLDETHFDEIAVRVEEGCKNGITMSAAYNTFYTAPTRSGKGVSSVVPILANPLEVF